MYNTDVLCVKMFRKNWIVVVTTMHLQQLANDPELAIGSKSASR